MALFNLRQTFTRQVDGLDEVVISWGVDGPTPTPGVLGAIIDRWQADHTAAAVTANIWRMVWQELAAYPAVGGPAVAVAAVSPAFTWGSSFASPPELALAVSREVVTVRGTKPVGRVFWPVGTVTAARPTASLISKLGILTRSMHQSLVLEGYAPVILSRRLGGLPRAAPVGLPIVRYSVDDIWDTQRRRDFDTGTRTLFAL